MARRQQLVGLTVRGLRAGGYEACQGPVVNANFPYVVLGRFLLEHRALRIRNHARRDTLRIDWDGVESQDEQGGAARTERLEDALRNLDEPHRRAIQTALGQLVKQKHVDNLYGILLPLFE